MATGDDLAREGLRHVGKPYVWATAGPDTFDCSGFVYYCVEAVTGQDLVDGYRDSHLQYQWGEAVEGWGARGDLLFFDTADGGEVRLGNNASHVGIALGGGEMVHAPAPGDVVKVVPLNDWYRRRYLGARRVLPAARAEGGGRRAEGVPSGPILAPNTWNGGGYGVDWSLPLAIGTDVIAAAREFGIEPRDLLRVVVIETQGLHERDGAVIARDDGYGDGPSVGVTQIKPGIWGWVLPDADAWSLVGNLRLAAATLARMVAEHGGIEEALLRGWFTGSDPNGTTQRRYLETFRRLGDELGGWPGKGGADGDAEHADPGCAADRAGAGGGRAGEGGRAGGAVGGGGGDRRRRRAGGAGRPGAAGRPVRLAGGVRAGGGRLRPGGVRPLLAGDPAEPRRPGGHKRRPGVEK